MRFSIISIFPELIESYADAALLGRARRAKKIFVRTVNPRDFVHDSHRTVDDKPFGGGVGMVMKVEPIYKSLKKLGTLETNAKNKNKKRRVILLSANGRQFTQKIASEYTKKYDELVFICGRYEGVDARVAKHLADEELSVGPYVLTGGELPALVVIDAVSRLVPGVLGNEASLAEESHNEPGCGEYPQYTRPEKFKPVGAEKSWNVPAILLSGNHKKIAEWKAKKSAKDFN